MILPCWSPATSLPSPGVPQASSQSAGLFCAFQGCLFALKTAYDVRYANVGLGNVLYSKTIEDSFRRGDRLLLL